MCVLCILVAWLTAFTPQVLAVRVLWQVKFPSDESERGGGGGKCTRLYQARGLNSDSTNN